MKANNYAIIMAGGIGSRFWPLSTAANPKQFQDLLGTGESLLQRTFDRLTAIVPEENILLLTNEKYTSTVLEQLPAIKPKQVLAEPAMRNTAPCILYAALKIRKKDPNAVMLVAPSDHWIEDETAFAADIAECFKACREGDILCTLGIRPTFPHTGFGYIEYDNLSEPTVRGLRKVVKFREKPDYKSAKSFLEQGNFLWNAGIFIWGVNSIIAAFEKLQPELYALFCKGLPVLNTEKEAEFIRDNYAKSDNISIDYAIMENSASIYVLPASFDWNDLGSWGSLYDKLEKDGNLNAVVNASLISTGASGNLVRSGGDKLVVIDGLEDYIVVDKENVLLICPRSREQDIKAIVARVNESFGEQYN